MDHTDACDHKAAQVQVAYPLGRMVVGHMVGIDNWDDLVHGATTKPVVLVCHKDERVQDPKQSI